MARHAALPNLHGDLLDLRGLLGTWEGIGNGEYPTIERFSYHESITFGHVGKPFLAYGQKTAAAQDGRPLHAETGYWRRPARGRVEIILAHPTGIAEILEGSLKVERGVIEIHVASDRVGMSDTAKRVDATERTFVIDGDQLTYNMSMAAVGQPMQHHLSAGLRRRRD